MVFPGPRKKVGQGLLPESIHAVDIQHPVQHQAGADGIPGRRGVADIADDGCPGAQLVGGNRAAGFGQQRIMLLNITGRQSPGSY